MPTSHDTTPTHRTRAEHERDEAKRELKVVRECVKRLGPDGPGIKWEYKDGHSTHEKSICEVRQERDAEVEAAKTAQERAEQARAQAESERDAAIEAREVATKARKSAEAARDRAASQLRDIRDDVEALGPNGYGIDWEDGHEQSLREMREKVADARDELDGVYRDINQAREDLKVTAGRRTLGLRDVVASVVGVVAGALEDSGFPKVAAWLRERADRLTERTIDRIAPETVRAHRALADPSFLPDDAETSVDYTAAPRRDLGPDV